MFFCKKKCKEIDTGKAYAYCLLVGCPELISFKNWKKLNKLKKKYKGRQQNLIKFNNKNYESNDKRN